MKRLETDVKEGLSADAAKQRLLESGPNRLPEGKQQSLFTRFLLQFNNILVYVLLGVCRTFRQNQLDLTLLYFGDIW